MTTYNQALSYAKKRRRRVIDKRRIPSEKERIRKVKKKGGFDDSWIDDEAKKNLSKTHYCWYCKERLKPIFDYVNTKGKIIMSCDTDECPGNYAEKRSSYSRKVKKNFARHIDRVLMFDLTHLMYGRDPSRLWATRKGTI